MQRRQKKNYTAKNINLRFIPITPKKKKEVQNLTDSNYIVSNKQNQMNSNNFFSFYMSNYIYTTIDTHAIKS